MDNGLVSKEEVLTRRGTFRSVRDCVDFAGVESVAGEELRKEENEETEVDGVTEGE